MNPLEIRTRPWRTGRKVGRTIYAMPGDEPSDMDPLIGVLDTSDLAQQAVNDHNLVWGHSDGRETDHE